MCYNVKQKKNERATMLQGMNFIPHNTTAKTSSFIFRYSLYSLNEKKIKGRSFNRLSVFFEGKINEETMKKEKPETCKKFDGMRKWRELQQTWCHQLLKIIYSVEIIEY